MRDSLKSSVRRLTAGWFWPLVLLVLPNCSFQGQSVSTATLDPGPLPHTSAIMCDVQKVDSRHCATPEEIAMGIPLAQAAIALTTNQHSNIGLDFSQGALSVCGGQPQAITFEGLFPDGYAACLNCGTQIPAVYADANAVCVAECQDLITADGASPMGGIPAYCQAVAHASTNFPVNSCFDNACSTGGTLRDDFADPRRLPEPVVWQDLTGTSANNNNLTRTAPTTGPTTADFNAGAASMQPMTHGDGYVEFEASEANLSHVLGLTPVPCFPCADLDPSIADIGFAISLNNDGRYYVVESGSLVSGPDINGSFGTYVAGERFRIKAHDNLDGTGTSLITYARVDGSCVPVPGTPCPDTPFYQHMGGGPLYPVRIDTSFREQGATLANVNIVRIQ